MSRERAIPSATSPLASGQPLLRPSGAGLRVGERSENTEASGPETGQRDAVAPRRHDATEPDPPQAEQAPARRRGRTERRPAPRAADAVALTVRFDQAEATELDLLVLELREETGRRLDKAEIVRELLRLTREHTGARQALVRRLKA